MKLIQWLLNASNPHIKDLSKVPRLKILSNRQLGVLRTMQKMGNHQKIRYWQSVGCLGPAFKYLELCVGLIALPLACVTLWHWSYHANLSERYVSKEL